MIITLYPQITNIIISALVSAHAGQFGISSKAFMKIDSLPNVTENEKEKYHKLAMEIFLK